MPRDENLNQQKYNPLLDKFNFPRPTREKDISLPSLEGIRDSEKTEYFSVPEKENQD